jgi:hypothetical protein
MPTCREIAAQATDYAEGHLGAAERERWEGHVAGCAGCASFARQLAIGARAAGALPGPELPLALRQRLLAAFDERAARQAGAAAAAPRPRWLAPFSALAVLAAFTVLLLPARRPSRSASDWGVALALVALAAVLALRGGRVTWGVAAVVASAAGAAALLGGGPGALHVIQGLDCLASELGAVAGTAGAMWLVLRRGPGALARTPLGALAVAGALAGAGALQVTCGAHGSTAHALAFHLGGVLAVGAGAALLSRERIRVRAG